MVNRAKIKLELEKAIQKALQQTTALAENTINNYLLDLERHIGGTTTDMGWQPLAEGDTKFWYETGAVASHIISKITIEKNRIHVVAGLPKGVPGYQEALWNEFGWTPHGTSKVIRRALFVPLAEYHIKELNTLLHEKFSKIKLNIRIII